MLRFVAAVVAWLMVLVPLSSTFAQEPPHPRYYFLIDNSGSMNGIGPSSHGVVLPALQKTLEDFVGQLPLGVEVRAWRFAEKVDAVAHREIRSEADRVAFLQAVNEALNTEGLNTYLYKSIASVLEFVKQQEGPAPTVLVFTDGEDTEGRLSFDEVVGKAEEVQVAKKDLNLFVYTLGFKSPDMASKGPVKVTDVPKPTAPFKVRVDPPVAMIDASPREAYVGTEVLFLRPGDAGGGPIHTYEWQFGDGQQSSDKQPRHIYDEPGEYSVSLKVVGPGGEDTRTEADFIQIQPKPAPAPPKARFEVRPYPVRPGEEAIFLDLSEGLVDHYLWDFGDGSTSTERNPAHRYEDVGKYPVVLKVSGPGGAGAEASQVIEVVRQILTPSLDVSVPLLAGDWLQVRAPLSSEEVEELACKATPDTRFLGRLFGGGRMVLKDDGTAESGDARAGDGIYSGRWQTGSSPTVYRLELQGTTASGVPIRAEQRATVFLAVDNRVVDLGTSRPCRATAEFGVQSTNPTPVTVRVLTSQDGPAAVVPAAGPISIDAGEGHVPVTLQLGMGGNTGPFRLAVPLEVAGVDGRDPERVTVEVVGTVISPLAFGLRWGGAVAAAVAAGLLIWVVLLVPLLRTRPGNWQVRGPGGAFVIAAALRKIRWRTVRGLFVPTPAVSIGGTGSDLSVVAASGPLAWLRPTRRGLRLENATGLEQHLGGDNWEPIGRGPLLVQNGLRLRTTAGESPEEIEITQ